MTDYSDLIHMQRPVSKKHKPMPMENRAAQFAPFAALTGFEEGIEATARQAEEKFDRMGRAVSSVEDIDEFWQEL